MSALAALSDVRPSGSSEGYSGTFSPRGTSVLIPPWYLFRKGKLSHVGGFGGALRVGSEFSEKIVKRKSVRIKSMSEANNAKQSHLIILGGTR